MGDDVIPEGQPYFVGCSFIQAMEAIDDGKRARIVGLPKDLYFRKVVATHDRPEKICLCRFTNYESQGSLDVIVRVGMAVMGGEEWQREG